METKQDWSTWIEEQTSLDGVKSKPEALDDIVVLDLSDKNYAGCICSSLLGEFGARVIRVERPGGDFLRTCTPYGILHQGEGLNYLTEGRNKFHITLDLEKPEGREILKSLAVQADILVETFLPGVMDDWGIGYEDLKKINPRLIFASITPHGQFGPKSKSRMPDYDNITQARSGIQACTGEVMPEGKTYDDCPWAVPTKAGPWIGWAQSGTFMALGVLAALHWRHTSGEGQAVDVSTWEAYNRFDDVSPVWYHGTGIVAPIFGSLDKGAWLYCFSPTKDGAVFLGGLRLEMWQAFADIVGKYDEWEAASWDDLTIFTREELQLEWSVKVFEATKQYTTDELVEMGVEYGKTGRLAPITPVIAPVVTPMETMQDENWKKRGIIAGVQDPLFGEIIVAQSQHKMTETPIRTKWVCRPTGYDNDYIYLKELGFGPVKLKELKDAGII